MKGEEIFLNELKQSINNGTPKNDLKTLINQRLKQLKEVELCSHREGQKCINPSSCKAFGCNKPM